MGSVYVLVLIAALSSHCSAYAVSHSETDISTSSVILKEGQSAEISCMTKGTGDFFWRKGETLHNSTLVAFFTVGEVSDDSQQYSVTENGTLHIRSVTLKDEGNYFCRVSSAENECYGEVEILVQTSLRNFDLAIDRCDGESSCVLYLDPYQFTSLTCTALNAPPLMTLKWFNGAKEITEGIEQNEILPQNGNSREITSTVAAVYGHPASLTCQAVDPKRSNDDVRFANARVEMTAWANRKKYKMKKEENVRLLTVEAEQFEEKSRLKKEKDDEISRLKKEKNDEISRLKDKLRPKEEELGKCMNDIIELQQTIKGKINAAEKAIKENITAAEKEKDDEISRLKLSAKAKDTEISKLKKEIAGNEEKIIAAEGDVRSKARSITELEKKVEQKEKEINNQREKYSDCQTNLQKKEIALQGKSVEISDLKGNLTQKDDALREITIKLEKSKAIVKEKNVELWNTSEELAELKEEFTKLKELYKNLKGAQQHSQNKPRKKHQGNDGD